LWQWHCCGWSGPAAADHPLLLLLLPPALVQGRLLLLLLLPLSWTPQPPLHACLDWLTRSSHQQLPPLLLLPSAPALTQLSGT
jgi:hypothetical protein